MKWGVYVMVNDKYTTIKFTKDFCELIDKIIDKSSKNYATRSDVIKTAIRELYEKEKEKG